MSKRTREDTQGSKSFKKSRLQNARNIRTQINDSSFKDGVLDVESFVDSRKFEIEELEKAFLKSKYSKSTRVFQALPRRLRRRAASHNVKRIPKRLRNKAIREMMKSNTVSEASKNGKKGGKDGSKVVKKPNKKRNAKYYYHKTMQKALLKTIANINGLKIIPSDQLTRNRVNLRRAIKILQRQIKEYKKDPSKQQQTLNNTYGSYDSTGVNCKAEPAKQKIKYMKRQSKFRWISTHIWHAKRFHFVKRWGWNIPYKPNEKSFKITHRSSRKKGFVCVDTSYEGSIIVQAKTVEGYDKVVEFAESLCKDLSAKVLRGVEFYSGEFWSNSSVISKGLMYANKKSLQIFFQVHPGDFSFFWETAHKLFDPIDSVTLYDCRYSLGSIDLAGPKSMQALLSILFAKDDVRKQLNGLQCFSNLGSIGSKSVFSAMVSDPRFLGKPRIRNFSKLTTEDEALDLLIDLKTGKLNDPTVISNLFSQEGRNDSYKDQLTTKALGAKQSKENGLITITNEDLKIPLAVFVDPVCRKLKVIMPWFWVSAFWYVLQKVSGVTPGGLLQLQQLDFENNTVSYPGDYPCTELGAIENDLIGIEATETWKKKSKGKRLEYSKVKVSSSDFVNFEFRGEIGDWSKCDWRFLQLKEVFKAVQQEKKRLGVMDADGASGGDVNPWDKTFLRASFGEKDIKNYVEQVIKVSHEHKDYNNYLVECQDPEAEFQVFEASISQFLSSSELAEELVKTLLPVRKVRVILQTTGTIKTNARIYTDNDSFVNLVGFVTTGCFNLVEGRPVGFGTVVGNMESRGINGRKCIVRNSGVETGRDAIFEFC